MEQELHPPTNTSGRLYAHLILTCYSEGLPPPKINWLKQNETFSKLGSSLVFEELTFTDRGFYKCRASNSEKSDESELIQLIVKGTKKKHFLLYI